MVICTAFWDIIVQEQRDCENILFGKRDLRFMTTHDTHYLEHCYALEACIAYLKR